MLQHARLRLLRQADAQPKISLRPFTEGNHEELRRWYPARVPGAESADALTGERKRGKMSTALIHWEGQIVNDEFQLQKYLGGSEQSAVFLTELPGRSAAQAQSNCLRQIARMRSSISSVG